MNPLHDFLTWFDGWAENIEGAPSVKQWDRLKARIDKTRADAKAAPQVPASASYSAPAPAPPAKPTTPTAWRAHYQAALLEMGVDEDSAKEFAATADVDMNRDPAAAAKADVGPMLN